jgi:hypothetical protein
MLRDVVKAMDKNGDQVIQYEGMFCALSLWCFLDLHCVQHTNMADELFLFRVSQFRRADREGAVFTLP